MPSQSDDPLTPQAPSAIAACEPGPAQATPDPASRSQQPTLPGLAATGTGRRVGLPAIPGYQLLEELGRGGMGVVYKAHHVALNRIVALKMILAGDHADEAHRERFRAEAEAVARLQHPHIVQIHEIGEHGGLAYFSLEFCEGGSLRQKLQGTPLRAADAAKLVETLARAADAAHRQDIVHRDLKPHNVLLTGDGTLKITDFGLAKRLNGAGPHLTESGSVLGTPSYMAPEQARGDANAIGPATDVYALGAILYEALTGRPPFRAATGPDTLVQVLHDDPVPPTRLQPKVPRDLETICLTCLHKEPRRRYSSGAALAEDLRRFQAGEPIAARRVGRLERFVKWCRRRPAVAGLLLALAVVIAAAAVTDVAQYQEILAALDYARDQEKDARDQKYLADLQKVEADKLALAARKAEDLAKNRADELEIVLANTNLMLAQRAFDAGNVFEARARLDLVPAKLRFFEWGLLKRHFAGGLFTAYGHSAQVSCVCFSADGQRMASASWDKTIKLWDARSGKELATLDGHTANVTSVAFSPDGNSLASASWDNTVRLWDARSGKELAVLRGHTAYVTCVVFSPDGQRLASAADDATIKLWDVRLGQEVATLQGHTKEVKNIVFTPDGQRLASAGWDQTIKLWDVRLGQEVASFGHGDKVNSVAVSGDGLRLASGGADHAVKLWDVRSRRELATLRGHTWAVISVAFSPDGQRLASASYDQTVKLWDVAKGLPLASLRGHLATVSSIAFSPDGQCLASASWDKTLKVWDAHSGQESATLRGHSGAVNHIAVSPDGTCLASAGNDQTIRLWDGKTGHQRATLLGHTDVVRCVAFSADGQCLASAGNDHTVRLWDVQGGQELATLCGHKDGVRCVALSSDGQYVASADTDQTVKLWDVNTGQEVATLRGHSGYVTWVAFSADSRRLVSASADQTLKLWDVLSRKELATFAGHADLVLSVAFSADGRRLASASADRTIKVWDVASSKEIATLRGHTQWVTGVAFSPDGQRLVSSSRDQTIKLWDIRSDQELVTLRGHTDKVNSVVFSANGQRLISAGSDQTVKVWSARPGQEVVTLRGHTHRVTGVTFDAAGKLVVARDKDGKILTWEIATGKLVAKPQGWVPKAASALNAERTLLALVNVNDVTVIDLRPLDEWERGYRPWVTRFDAIWHHQQIAFNVQAGNPATALVYLDQLLERHADEAGLAENRLKLLAMATAKVPNNPLWAAFATTALQQGDAVTYQQVLAKLLAQAAGNDTEATMLAARTAVLGSEVPAELRALLIALEKLPSASRSATDCWIEGGLRLRLGDAVRALPLLEKAVAERAGEGPPHAELLLAIASKKLGKSGDAQAWLAKAAAWMDLAHREPEANGRRLAWRWQVWEELRVLRREAAKSL